MTITIPDLMRETRNYFPTAALDGSWSVQGGVLSPAQQLREGDWIAVTGSARHNGVYQLGAGAAIPSCGDEAWQGRVWLLSPPPAFIALAEDIAAWIQRHQDPAVSRESFGAYSVAHVTGAGGTPLNWQDAFAAALQPYRRMFSEVKFSC